MSLPVPDTSVRDDLDTLRSIATGLSALAERWLQTRPLIGARDRGYFTPDEDDVVRQLVLAYRNYRIGLWDIISRCRTYRDIPDPERMLQRFLVGFGAGLTLYRRALQLVEAYEHVPLVRAKLNEPEPRFDLPVGFFDEVIRTYGAFGNYRLLQRGNRDWRRFRKEVSRYPFAGDEAWQWLDQYIRRERRIARSLFWHVVRYRVKHDWRSLWSTTFRPINRTRYSLRATIGERFAGYYVSGGNNPALRPELLKSLRSLLKPGDVLLVRAEGKLTSTLLPGFWAHAAIYIGGRKELEAVDQNLVHDPRIQRHWENVKPDGGPYGQVIEAIAPRVLINGLERCLVADHVAVLRPVLSEAQRAEALVEAFSHLGKDYDFEFDFNITHRVVCTELVYRSFHRRGDIAFTLTKRLGRYTLTGDDLMHLAIDAASGRPGRVPMFDIPVVALKFSEPGSRFLAPREIMPKLRAIRKGWRPTVLRGD